ncbi:MAG: M20/M25/M40 family metallo-hydrolase [Altibacter sp.]|uniref:M20/M25/M40 family metallo-hydrolase n=1 Tax=Altibacter sp. TaxID=2024823 RepID=UPI001E152D3D|nr:M20/M25/M40 family metallo-hydrolase [Altibacter sp.]MBZ0328601.1 M20/M25/M40 family metallo-hydrolase [Altibacter sp.]
MKKILTLLLLFLVVFSSSAQDTSFYATMALNDAEALKSDLPLEVEILAKKQNEAVVYMTENASHMLHDRVLVHGPGYVFKPSYEDAIAALERPTVIPANSNMVFTITEDQWVQNAMDAVNTQNIEDQILVLQNYGTRYHNRASATQAANDLKTKWENMAASYGRTDVSVRLFNHVNTNMPSVIMTIAGAETPDEFVIVGGHLDSTANPSNDNAPGADDDASGISTITEAARALFETGFVPKKSIEFMAYAAEEIGLVGSAEIAQEYANNNINVSAVVQFDMTNYNGSGYDVGLITDYTSPTLTGFLSQLMDHYNASGAHQFSYGASMCNYGCSDHASWTAEGYMAAFPFESGFGQHNPNIHTANDVFSISGNAEHAAKFSKLCVEFLIEASKSDIILAVSENELDNYQVYVTDSTLNYSLTTSSATLDNIVLYDILGKRIMQLEHPKNSGQVSLEAYASGFYIVTLEFENGKQFSKRIVVE